MKTCHMLATAATAGVLLSAAAFAQTPAPVPADKQCSGLTGAALDSCLKSAPGRSGDAASRTDGRTPGKSEDAAAKTGTPPTTVPGPIPSGGRSGEPKGSSEMSK
jgi:hypothetical protein